MIIRIILLLTFLSATVELAFSQARVKKADSSQPSSTTAMPSKGEMLSQMNEATNEIKKQIAELETQLKATSDPDEKKSLQEQINMLQKQVGMMHGLNRNMSGLSEKVYKQAAAEGSTAVPQRDATRISILPKKTLSEAELPLFIKNVHAGVEKLIPASERAEALNIYNETKAKYKSTPIVANAATGCWMLGHWEKALYILGKACLDDITDADNLNNYAAFLIMTGGEQAALPILEYLNKQYPDNSTILNNIGQAWYGLGDLDQAKKFLTSATELYPNHSTANSTLSDIAIANNDPATAISALKASLKETYDPEKEGELRKLGYEITFDDMPPFNYPMKDDPFGLIPLINSWPETIQSSIDDLQPAFALQRYLRGINSFHQELSAQNEELEKKLRERSKKISADSSYQLNFLEPFDCPAYLQAARSVELINFEAFAGHSPLITQLWLPFKSRFTRRNRPYTMGEVFEACKKIWTDSVVTPIAKLSKAMLRYPTSLENCEEVDEMINKFLEKRAEIYSRGTKLVKKEFIKRSKGYNEWIKLTLYAAMDGVPEYKELQYAMIADLNYIIARNEFENGQIDFLLGLIGLAEQFQSIMQGRCHPSPGAEKNSTDEDNIAALKVKWLECEYVKKVITPVQYEFVLRCNTVTEKNDGKLKKRKPDTKKGSGQNASRRNSSSAPIQGPHGPNILPDEIDDTEQESKGPLTAEKKDLSQFSLEYNKWGNLVGFNFQLSEDGSMLKDPDSIESGVDSRWSWNAVASPKKGHMNKLLLK